MVLLSKYFMAYPVVFSALAYKEIEYEYRGVHLVKDGGQQVCI